MSNHSVALALQLAAYYKMNHNSLNDSQKLRQLDRKKRCAHRNGHGAVCQSTRLKPVKHEKCYMTVTAAPQQMERSLLTGVATFAFGTCPAALQHFI
jgi:hypothetical protein